MLDSWHLLYGGLSASVWLATNSFLPIHVAGLGEEFLIQSILL